MKKITLLVAIVASFTAGYAQSGKAGRQAIKKTGQQSVARGSYVTPNTAAIIYTDNFNGDNSVAGLVARGYATYYRGTGPVGITPEFYQGTPASTVIAFNGPDTGYVASDYNSVTGINDIDNWLVTPQVNVAAGDSISFWAATPMQTAGSEYLDSIRVMYNPTGATLPEDTGWVELDRFELDWATGNWTRYAYEVPTASATGVFALRYTVAAGGPGSLTNSYYIGIDQLDVFNNITSGNFDDCGNAVDINSAFGGTVGTMVPMGPYDNSTATVDPSDPADGWSCFGEPDGGAGSPELNNTVWFTFTGDGNNYTIVSSTTSCGTLANPFTDGDTQFALYTGACGSLVALKCNEDVGTSGPPYPAGFSFGTQVGTTYYLMVDGFNATSIGGGVSSGEFCLNVTRVATVTCADASVTSGTQAQSDTSICVGDTVTLSTTGAVSPNSGNYFGVSWIISDAPITGSTDPLLDPALVATYTFTSPVPVTSTRTFINDGTAAFITQGNTYYWTPVVFGNAVQSSVGSPVFLSDLTLDPTCTTTGTSMAVLVRTAADPACLVSVHENLAGKTESMIAYPSPAQNLLNVEFTAAASDKGVLEVTDLAGKVVMSSAVAVKTGTNKVELDVKKLSAGTYFVSLKNNEGRTVKFVKQ